MHDTRVHDDLRHPRIVGAEPSNGGQAARGEHRATGKRRARGQHRPRGEHRACGEHKARGEPSSVCQTRRAVLERVRDESVPSTGEKGRGALARWAQCTRVSYLSI
eukprot:scaffold110540_cov66-Phaeocystis_antarctica.AAC.4